MFKSAVASLFTALVVIGFAASSDAGLLFSEIHYHPVEEPAFDAGGSPALDLSDDVHEFVELHNFGASAVSLDGWRLAGGVAFAFPNGLTVPPGGFIVIGRNPARLAAIPQYALAAGQVLGPYTGTLGNSGDVVRLQNGANQIVDSVSYDSAFPWAITANALGADEEWTGVKAIDHQYRGRSLERVSFTHPATDPANWLASPLSKGPSPGRTNAVQRAVPQPVVVGLSAAQADTGDILIRSNQPVRIEVSFSSLALSNVSLEYFVEDIAKINEPRVVSAMSADPAVSDTGFSATLPGFASRAIVRYRIRADRGNGVEPVSPRADDPFSWHSFFITPPRLSSNPIYDVFVSQASLDRMNANISQSPRRIELPDPPGKPRASWNATEPAILVVDGKVYDIQIRYHGSRYRRSADRKDYKLQLPRYSRLNGRSSFFETDKAEEHLFGWMLYAFADLPIWKCRSVDLYLNAEPLLPRVEQEELNADVYDRWIEEQGAKYPDRHKPSPGWFYKSEGVVPFENSAGIGAATSYTESGEGPYYIGNCAPIPAKAGWSLPARYDWTYPMQMDSWRGGVDMFQMVTGLWNARGDAPTAPRPRLPDLRDYLATRFNVDATLAYIAIRNWSAPFDDATQNHFLWKDGDGRWGMLPWDLDNEFSNSGQSVFWDEWEVNQPDTLRGPQWVKDSFLKTFREEYKRKLFILNHTLLTPANLTAIGAKFFTSYASGRGPSVDSELRLGPWYSPRQPVVQGPTNTASVFPPAALVSSAYSHLKPSSPPPHASSVWVVRRASGGYTNPVFRVDSPSNLTSLPIPFDRLEFGETYFWKVTYVDGDGHPSPDSGEGSFTYGPALVPVPILAIDVATLWRYNASGTNPPANWAARDFDDRDWPQGPALLGNVTGKVPASKLPEPLRTVFVRSNYVAFYFRAPFVFAGDPLGAQLRIRQVIDDGAIVYLNGVEVSRTGLPRGTVGFKTGANRNVGDAVYEGPIAIDSAPLVSGTNVIAVEVHQASPNSGNDVVFGLTLDARVPASPGAVRLNEILADNQGAAINADTTPDYIELLNTTGLPQPLGNFSLSDDPELPGKYVFPADVVIPPHASLVIWCDSEDQRPGLHAGFALDNDAQTVALFAVGPNGYQLVDSVTYGLQAPNKSIGRLGDGAAASNWTLCDPTPGDLNIASPLGATSGLRVNEWMASASDGPDWFEIYNTGAQPTLLSGLFLSDTADAPANTRIAPLSFIAGGGFRQMIADGSTNQGPRHVGFKLSGSGESVVLSDSTLKIIDAISFGPQTVDVSQGRLPDGSATIVSFPGSNTPEAPNARALGEVVINELLANPIPDQGQFIELANTTSAAQDVSGWWISDDIHVPKKARIPQGTTLLPNGYWVLPELLFNAVGDPSGFALDPLRGGHLYLSTGDAAGNLTGRRNSIRYTPSEVEVSQGRVATSSGVDFWAQNHNTPGAANSGPKVGPVVVGEIQYDPENVLSDPSGFEFVELINTSAGAVRLYDPAHPGHTWSLRGGVQFDFPSGVTLQSAERVLVVPFDPDTNAPAMAAFVNAYTLPQGTRIWGPYSGHLGNSGDTVDCVKPGVPDFPPGSGLSITPAILVDRVRYGADAPWPSHALAGGRSLQRLNPLAYGDEPLNWRFAPVSPGAPASDNAAPVATWVAPADGLRVEAGATISISAAAKDDDGAVRRVEFIADDKRLGIVFAPPFALDWTGAAPGFHRLSALAVDDRLALGRSAEVAILVVPPLAPSILPTNTYVRLGSNTAVRVGISSPDLLRFQWFHNGSAVAAATNDTFNVVKAKESDLGSYWVRVSDTFHTLETTPVSLIALVDPVIIQQPLPQAVVAGGDVTLSVTVNDAATLPLGFRWRRNNVPVPGGFFALNSRVCFLTVTNLPNLTATFSVQVTNIARPSGVLSANAALTFLPDSDKDGIPDVFEQDHKMNPQDATDRDADLDGDRMSNWAEFIAGTDPTDPKSHLRLDTLPAAGGLKLLFQAVSNRTYAVEFRADLKAGQWAPLSLLEAAATNRSISLVDPAAGARRYYRLVTPAQPQQ
ncbi:MAG: lamin tail domain-containing protein [Verrucomicrobia bacterium]|nr:lamin tail domain-containing protein [Verrucomicrobiota bacterium]